VTSVETRVSQVDRILDTALSSLHLDLGRQLQLLTNNDVAGPEDFRRHAELMRHATNDLVAEAKDIHEELDDGTQPRISCTIGFVAAVIAIPTDEPVPQPLLDLIKSRADQLWPPPWGMLPPGNAVQTYRFRECMALAALQTPTGETLRKMIRDGQFYDVRASSPRLVLRREGEGGSKTYDHLGNPIDAPQASAAPAPTALSGFELVEMLEARAIGNGPTNNSFPL
jgi:hypothetical protein